MRGGGHDHAAAHKLLPDDIAHERDEQENADRAGDKTRYDEQDRGQNQHGAMHHFTVGHAACGGFGADTLQKAYPLHAQEEETEHCTEDNKTQCRKHADITADDDETGDLDEWHRQHDEGGKGRGHGGYDLMLLVSCSKLVIKSKRFYAGMKLKLSIMQYQIGMRDLDLNDR